MVEQELINPKVIKNKETEYFSHHKSQTEINNLKEKTIFSGYFFSNIHELQRNDWELHKRYLHEGINPLSISIILRHDDIDKLQQEVKNDFNQTISPSLYERCSFINKLNVSLVDYCAFFGSIKCFKYLITKGATLNNTGKFAVAGGNIEIIKICEENNSSFVGAYEAAIEFHRNELFHYFYERKIIENVDKTKLGIKCIECGNFKILSFLLNDDMNVDENVMLESAIIGNLYVTKQFLADNEIPNRILVNSVISGNFELVQCFLDITDIDVNFKDFYLFCFLFD